MPRPGPRPYECVRRAWHSDRHQPMRGSLIQEIFRVANEVHNPGTRKNKEWQEKLPIVVLKAEEIMYSKANSETEYMDIKTLWDRANDAIDTIIRRDDTPDESGQDLLHPCIEAALNLGCIPRRASRSQRLSNPGIYLSFNNKEAMAAAEIPDNTMEAQLRSSSKQFPSWYPPTCSKPALSISHDTSLEQKNPLPLDAKDPILESSNATTEATTLSNLGRVYPLYYYGTSQISPRDMTSKTSSLASPSVASSTSEFQTCFLLSKLDTMDPSKRTSLISPENPPDSPFDLSLRLGLLTHEAEDIGSNSSSSDLSRFCVS